MNKIINYLLNKKEINEIIDGIKLNKNYEIGETDKTLVSLISMAYREKENKNVVIITPSTYQAQKIYDLIGNFDDVYFYPKDDFIATELLTESYEFKLERINTIKAILNKDTKKIIIVPFLTLLSKIPLKETYISKIITIKKDSTYKIKDLLNILIDGGYKRCYTVEKQGEFSLRGEVFDIFPINENKAYRITFNFDDIESIKEFDLETQRSIKEEKEIVVMPKDEIFFTSLEKETINYYINSKLEEDITLKTKEKFNEDLILLNEKREYQSLSKYLSLFINENHSLLDYIDDKEVFFYDIDAINNQELVTENEINNYLEEYRDYFNNQAFLNRFFIEDYNNAGIFKTKAIEKIKIDEVPLYQNRLDLFKADYENSYKDKTVVVSIKDNDLKEVFIEFLKQSKIPYNLDSIKENKLNIVEDDFINFESSTLNTVFINETNLFKTILKNHKYDLAVETKRLKSLSELKIGDYVVHQDYGIGRFKEITTMELKGQTSDFIHIEYAKEQSVYIPVENIFVLSKYTGSESAIPKLTSLNSGEWKKTKDNVRKKANDLAKRLLTLYSERENIEGFRYLKDDDTQREFENDFKYEVTKDQLQAIEDSKRDMESDKLMDRLICGDVGFGKTEVALRCAFKAVLSGKQVAYLAPTTILARQHYYTFKERMDKFGVNVRLVSRFVQPKEIKNSLNELERGVVDIIIGTHRLLSNDVKFKNLGLLIIDEEQRFGVEAKEKLKELKNNIDCLTLTATPIPRTLEMAISGIKSVSLIETAPKGRYPVQTYVLERNDFIVKDAIERELSKGGQVFYLYNRVEDMERVEMYIHSLVPEARIEKANGKMDKNELEDTLNRFINKESDILLTTTIIETGVDMPNVNTIIIHDSERYGLSQLYQIKGRVGRSNKISYAYLMYDKGARLTEDTCKRLEAIKDFTELGSGFKIALRDLTTRGAGEILGKEQAGFMDKVGVSLYLKMLDEEIKKEKGEAIKNEEDDQRLKISRHIDKDYISDDYTVIDIHSRISKIQSLDELNNMVSELTDRFGKVRDNLLEYMYSKLSENLMNSMDFERVDIFDYQIRFVISEEKSKDIDATSIFKYAFDTSPNFDFYMKVRKIFIEYNQKGTKLEMYKHISSYLERLKKDMLI